MTQTIYKNKNEKKRIVTVISYKDEYMINIDSDVESKQIYRTRTKYISKEDENSYQNLLDYLKRQEQNFNKRGFYLYKKC